jgi:hypothetical protein
MRTRVLRTLLLASAVAWGIAFSGALAPWPLVEAAMHELGASTPIQDPMVQYWIRMACGAYGLVGIVFLVAAMNPHRHAVIIPILGGLMAAEGLLIGGHALRLHLPPAPCAFDTAFCLLVGTGILVLGSHLRNHSGEKEVRP